MLDTQITSSPMDKKDTRDMTIALTVMIKKLMIEGNKMEQAGAELWQAQIKLGLAEIQVFFYLNEN